MAEYCRIWGVEDSNGILHHCHAAFKGVEGDIYAKELVPKILARLSGPHGTWQLRACEPQGDKSQCEGCPFIHTSGLARAWGIDPNSGNPQRR